MPKTVDRSERREALLAAVWRVIAHYFDDKEDILASALQLSHERITARWDEKLEGLEGLEALRELVLDNLPLDDERELETRFHFNYWTRLLTREELAAAKWQQGPQLVDRLSSLVEEARGLGQIHVAEGSADLAERLLALIDGLSLHALLNPERVTRERQAARVEQEFTRMATPTEGRDDA